MWKPTNTYVDGTECTAPEGYTDVQAAAYYGGVAMALIADLNEGNIEGADNIDKAVALGTEITDFYGLPQQGDAIRYAGDDAKDLASLVAMFDDDGDELFGDDDDFSEQHADSHRATKKAA